MKIRTSFVANSSSSSFCLWGIVVSECVDDELRDSFLTQQTGIADYYDEYVVGVSPSRMEENETKKQFKERILVELQRIFPDSNFKYEDIQLHVDGGYDG